MTNSEFQRECMKLRNELQIVASDVLALDVALPKRLKAFTVPRIVLASQQGGPVSIVDALKSVAQAIEDSRQMAEAWSRIDETATDTAVEAEPRPLRARND